MTKPSSVVVSQAALVDALDSLNEGFALFDAQDRLLLANRRCRDLFPELALELQPGASFEALARSLVAAGGVLDAIGREDEWFRERFQRRREHRGVDILRRPGGRSLKLTECATRGGGSVLIYRDFTELRRREDELATANRVIGHSERLAALGELIAGITHEIKNSLSLMSNFSEISSDMVDELRAALAAGGASALTPEADELLDTLKANLSTIVQHGARADGIVRSMLQSSRTSGLPVPTDVNRLVDEALTLAHYGTHAKTPGFTVRSDKQYDPACGLAAVEPQEISRVMLNLFSNAFHSMRRRQTDADDPAYAPTLQVTTRGTPTQVQVRVRDNGTGIRPSDIERVFTRFFTTKPVGEGTGLGLALCQDIVKRHQGRLTVRSELHQFAEFVLELPRHAALAGAGES